MSAIPHTNGDYISRLWKREESYEILPPINHGLNHLNMNFLQSDSKGQTPLEIQAMNT